MAAGVGWPVWFGCREGPRGFLGAETCCALVRSMPGRGSRERRSRWNPQTTTRHETEKVLPP